MLIANYLVTSAYVQLLTSLLLKNFQYKQENLNEVEIRLSATKQKQKLTLGDFNNIPSANLGEDSAGKVSLLLPLPSAGTSQAVLTCVLAGVLAGMLAVLAGVLAGMLAVLAGVLIEVCKIGSESDVMAGVSVE